MNHFFRFDGPVVLFLERIGQLLLLDVIWLFCSIPLFSFAASTSALYHVTLKIVRNEDNGIIKCFFRSFIVNLKQSIPLSLLIVAIALLLYVEFLCCLFITGPMKVILLVVFLLLTVLFIVIISYVFPLQAQFNNTVKQTLTNAILLSFRNLKSTAMILFYHSIPLCTFILFQEFFLRTLPLWILIIPALIAWLCSIQFNQIFLPYMQEDDSSSVV